MGEHGDVTERHDEAYEFDERPTVVGAQLGPSAPAPTFCFPRLTLSRAGCATCSSAIRLARCGC
jgi:hypothetical protein